MLAIVDTYFGCLCSRRVLREEDKQKKPGLDELDKGPKPFPPHVYNVQDISR